MSSSLLLPLLLIVLVVPLLLSARKQKRQMQSMQTMQKSLEPGDRVMTTSGMHATVVSHNEDTVDLEIADGIVTTWVIAAVREKVDTTEPGETESDDVEESGDATESTPAASEATETASTAELAPPLEHGKKSH